MSFKIVFAGTPDFASPILEGLLESAHEIIAVYTQPDRPAGRGRHLTASPVKKLALEHAIPVHQPIHLKDKSEEDRLQSLSPDLMIVAAYGLILPKSILSIPKWGCINVHWSLLPRWRGASPIQQAILMGDDITGITIMKMDVGMDTGDILSLYPHPILPTDTSETLYFNLAKLGSKALIETLEKLERNEITPQKQDDTKATLAPKLSKDQAKINWHESAIVIDRMIRAYYPWPIAFTHIEEQVLRIFKAQPLLLNSNAIPNATPGMILQVHPEGIDIATGEGTLRLLELQLPGGKRLTAHEMLNSKESLFLVGNFLT